MICQTIKNGIDCGFMTKKGCGFNGGSCNAIIDKCEGCGKVIECPTGKVLPCLSGPGRKVADRQCPTATHLKLDVKETTQKVNPLKASNGQTRNSGGMLLGLTMKRPIGTGGFPSAFVLTPRA